MFFDLQRLSHFEWLISIEAYELCAVCTMIHIAKALLWYSEPIFTNLESRAQWWNILATALASLLYPVSLVNGG